MGVKPSINGWYGGWLQNPNHQFKTVVDPTIYRVSTIPNWWCRISSIHPQYVWELGDDIGGLSSWQYLDLNPPAELKMTYHWVRVNRRPTFEYVVWESKQNKNAEIGFRSIFEDLDVPKDGLGNLGNAGTNSYLVVYGKMICTGWWFGTFLYFP